MYYIFAFRSRAESLSFFDSTKKKGICTRLISTPREISIGCGLSVKVEESDFDTAYELLETCKSNTFLGVFYCDGNTYNRANY